MKSFYLVCFFFSLSLSLSLSVYSATYTVSSNLDNSDSNVGDGICADYNGNCTLRAAVEEANFDFSSHDTVSLAGTFYIVNSELQITSPMDIIGLVYNSGASTTEIRGGGQNRVLYINNNTQAIPEINLDTLYIGQGSLVGSGEGACIYAENILDFRIKETQIFYCELTSSDDGQVLKGAGVFVKDSENVSFENTEIFYNKIIGDYHIEGFGAGAYFEDNQTVIFKDSKVHINFLSSVFNAFGGGIYSENNNLIKFEESYVGYNAVLTTGDSGSAIGGGMYATSDGETTSKLHAKGLRFWRNDAITYNSSTTGSILGGGLYLDDVSSEIYDSPFSQNTSSRDGGGVYFDESRKSHIFMRNSVNFNIAGNSGGGIFLKARGGFNFKAYNTTISSNIAGSGGGLACSASSYPFINLRMVTIVKNEALYDGGGFYADQTCSGALVFYASLIAKNINVAPTGLGPDCFSSANVKMYYYNFLGDRKDCSLSTFISYNYIGDSTDPSVGVLDPVLGSPNNDYRYGTVGSFISYSPMDATSPLVDFVASDCTTETGFVLSKDNKFLDRKADGDGNGVEICDIGAVEYAP